MSVRGKGHLDIKEFLKKMTEMSGGVFIKMPIFSYRSKQVITIRPLRSSFHRILPLSQGLLAPSQFLRGGGGVINGRARDPPEK